MGSTTPSPILQEKILYFFFVNVSKFKNKLTKLILISVLNGKFQGFGVFFLVYSSCFPKLKVCRLLAILKKKKKKENLPGALGEQLFSICCAFPRATFSSGLTQAADPMSKSLPQETIYTRPSVQVHNFFL